jgi:glycosyltransferase involved in cell wall biosynthesis
VRWEGRLERWLRVPSRWRRWWAENVVDLAGSLGGEHDVVHASVAPYSTAESAIAVARRLRRPLLLDLEDPWALDEMMVYPSRLHRLLERRRMGRVLRTADAVVMNTPEARRRVLDTFGLDGGRVVSIQNAFDRGDFDGVARARTDDRFRIVHTGSLHTDLGRRHRARGRLRGFVGGTAPGVDFLTRSHVFLLEAVERLRVREPELGSDIEVHLAGVFTAEDRAAAAPYAFVRLHEFLPHHENVALLRTADLLFLPMHDLPAGVRAGLVPHKTYEYLAAERPILGALPEGDARDLLAESGVARLCAPADVAGMAEAIRAEIERWRAGVPLPAPRAELLARVEAARLAAGFSDLYTTLARGARENP